MSTVIGNFNVEATEYQNVFKIVSPKRIDRKKWLRDKNNAGLAFIGTNFSDDYSECDIVYITKSGYGNLSALTEKLGEKYGYNQCLYTTEPNVEPLGLCIEI